MLYQSLLSNKSISTYLAAFTTEEHNNIIKYLTLIGIQYIKLNNMNTNNMKDLQNIIISNMMKLNIAEILPECSNYNCIEIPKTIESTKINSINSTIVTTPTQSKSKTPLKSSTKKPITTNTPKIARDTVKIGITNHRNMKPIYFKPSPSWRLGLPINKNDTAPDWWPNDTASSFNANEQQKLDSELVIEDIDVTNIVTKDEHVKEPVYVFGPAPTLSSSIVTSPPVPPVSEPEVKKEFMPKLKENKTKKIEQTFKPQYLTNVQSKIKASLERDRLMHVKKAKENKDIIKDYLQYNSPASLSVDDSLNNKLAPKMPKHAFISPESLSTFSPLNPIYKDGSSQNHSKDYNKNPDSVLAIVDAFAASPLMDAFGDHSREINTSEFLFNVPKFNYSGDTKNSTSTYADSHGDILNHFIHYPDSASKKDATITWSEQPTIYSKIRDYDDAKSYETPDDTYDYLKNGWEFEKMISNSKIDV